MSSQYRTHTQITFPYQFFDDPRNRFLLLCWRVHENFLLHQKVREKRKLFILKVNTTSKFDDKKRDIMGEEDSICFGFICRAIQLQKFNLRRISLSCESKYKRKEKPKSNWIFNNNFSLKKVREKNFPSTLNDWVEKMREEKVFLAHQEIRLHYYCMRKNREENMYWRMRTKSIKINKRKFQELYNFIHLNFHCRISFGLWECLEIIGNLVLGKTKWKMKFALFDFKQILI